MREIMLKYLDATHAALQALLDREVMTRNLKDTQAELEELHAKLYGLPTRNYDGQPHTPDPKQGERRLVNLLDTQGLLEAKLKEAKDFDAWFRPAWESLSEEDQYVLETYFCSQNSSYQASLEVAERFETKRQTANRKKDRALRRLALALYGR